VVGGLTLGSAKIASMALGTALSATIAASELLHWRASKRFISSGQRPGQCGLIVLGFPPKHDGTIHAVGRWRAQMAVRALALTAPGRLVFTGAAAGGGLAEANVMADYAIAHGAPRELVGIEALSINTWENISFCLPLLSDCERLAIVSDPLHAARGRRFVMGQRPDLAPRLVSAGDYRLLERWWLKIPCAAYELCEARPAWRRRALQARDLLVTRRRP
jgi:DUF218 domain